jgi:hypothetical protein
VTTSQPTHNIFQRGQEVVLDFAAQGRVPPEARRLIYTITDDRGKAEALGNLPAPASGGQPVRAAVSPGPGYYEIRGWWGDSQGQRLGGSSVIRAEGSVPCGIATFAVVPSTLAENMAAYQERGERSFLGIHGDFLGAGDLMGLAWCNHYSRWTWDEPQKPDRSAGSAGWATGRNLPLWPGARYRPHVLPASGNFPPPNWALRKGGVTPAYDWTTFEAWFRDLVRSEKRLYRWMKTRIYEPAWEIDLNRPPDAFQKPPYAPEDVVELHRRCRNVVQQEDPGGIVIGPCPSTLDDETLVWLEEVFKAGLAKTVDALSIHGYHAAPPERAGLPEKIARLNQLTRRYAGKVLPIYSTEIGYPDTVGSERDVLAQARYITRLSIILKGEGLKVFLPFYGIDYDSYHFGFCFNREMDHPWGPWSTKKISPKPAVPALAQAARILEGARPVKRMALPAGEDWGYQFDDAGRSIFVLWTIGPAKTLKVPVGQASAVEVQNMMGRSERLATPGGIAEISVDGSPRYILAKNR